MPHVPNSTARSFELEALKLSQVKARLHFSYHQWWNIASPSGQVHATKSVASNVFHFMHLHMPPPLCSLCAFHPNVHACLRKRSWIHRAMGMPCWPRHDCTRATECSSHKTLTAAAVHYEQIAPSHLPLQLSENHNRQTQPHATCTLIWQAFLYVLQYTAGLLHHSAEQHAVGDCSKGAGRMSRGGVTGLGETGHVDWA